jgi:hypothetical protein
MNLTATGRAFNRLFQEGGTSSGSGAGYFGCDEEYQTVVRSALVAESGKDL